MYFKGSWWRKFEKALTRDQPFHLGNGKTKTLPFMQRMGSYGYAEGKEFQALRIRYGEKDRMAFYVFLPKEGVSLSRLQDQLAAAGSKCFSACDSRMVQVELPRFKVECDFRLEPVLAALGMKKAFVPNKAEFMGMSPRGKELYIGDIYHKTYVDVNEEGTEAAAVTTVTVKAASVDPSPILFRVDRPFFCAIADDTTRTILFTGSIVDP